MKAFRTLLIYALLIIGSLVFIWPFLWMAATSAKLDRELFGETLRLLPERPIPRWQSPSLDDRPFGGWLGAVPAHRLTAVSRGTGEESPNRSRNPSPFPAFRVYVTKRGALRPRRRPSPARRHYS